jgi:hypothetical protein
MANRRPILPEDLAQLLDLIQKGKLFAVQDWIKTGKRLRAVDVIDCDELILCATISTGFHSLIEELLRAGGWSQHVLADALDLARSRKRYDIADLLLNYGAQPKQLDFQTCCRDLDLAMMERHLRAGTDPNRDNDFAQALSSVKALPLLRFYRQFRTEFPALDDQAALALSEAVQKNQIRWTALLVWAGADPFHSVPNDLSITFPVNPESCTTAAREAMWRNNPQILKALHLKPTPLQALDLLSEIAYHENFELVRSLIAVIPQNQINNTARGSCVALERMVSRSAHRDLYNNTRDGKGDAENLRCVELLLDAGARWNPPPENIRGIRRDIMQHDNRYIVEILRLLLYTPDAVTIENFLELCNSQTLQAKIAATDHSLARELHGFRKTSRLMPSIDATG